VVLSIAVSSADFFPNFTVKNMKIGPVVLSYDKNTSVLLFSKHGVKIGHDDNQSMKGECLQRVYCHPSPTQWAPVESS